VPLTSLWAWPGVRPSAQVAGLREMSWRSRCGTSDGNPFTSGAIGEWAAERNKAVDEAVPQIIERLRPKYGRMYNFDDAQPGNVRLLAMSIQPSLTNR
jgi:hypothetical protein